MIVVSNTSPITNLAAIGQLGLLHQIYQQIIIPEEVYRELTADGGIHPGAIVQTLNWIEVKSAINRALVTAIQLELDEGEAEAVALAHEIAADLVLIDERRGREVAARFGLRVLGLAGVLIEAKQRGLLIEIKPHLDALINSGFRISQRLYARILQAAGE